jgi:mono/diheme cytochrome c family protein
MRTAGALIGPLVSAAMFVATVAAAWISTGQPLSLHWTAAVAAAPAADLALPDRVVAAATLRAGYVTYQRHCAGCHGGAGDGRGLAGAGLSPPPRDFTRGAFKFAAVPSGALPRDEDLARTIRRGLAGTAMRGWALGDAELTALIQYLKTFSARWRRESPPAPAEVATAPDPWRDDPIGAVREGARVYHHEALCATCHPAYLPVVALRPDPGAPVAHYESAYDAWALSPDFRRHPPRAGDSVDDLHRAIAFGVGGTPMPTWQGALPDRALWALAYYVRSLTPAR